MQGWCYYFITFQYPVASLRARALVCWLLSLEKRDSSSSLLCRACSSSSVRTWLSFCLFVDRSTSRDKKASIPTNSYSSSGWIDAMGLVDSFCTSLRTSYLNSFLRRSRSCFEYHEIVRSSSVTGSVMTNRLCAEKRTRRWVEWCGEFSNLWVMFSWEDW